MRRLVVSFMILFTLLCFSAALAEPWYCSACDRINNESFCPTCGKSAASWTCGHCGAVNNDLTCSSCGWHAINGQVDLLVGSWMAESYDATLAIYFPPQESIYFMVQKDQCIISEFSLLGNVLALKDNAGDYRYYTLATNDTCDQIAFDAGLVLKKNPDGTIPFIIDKNMSGLDFIAGSEHMFSLSDTFGRYDVIKFVRNGQLFTARIVGLPRDTVEMISGKLYVNQQLINEYYVSPDLQSLDNVGPTTLTETEYFVLCDNRTSTNDSRRFGAVDLYDIAFRLSERCSYFDNVYWDEVDAAWKNEPEPYMAGLPHHHGITVYGVGDYYYENELTFTLDESSNLVCHVDSVQKTIEPSCQYILPQVISKERYIYFTDNMKNATKKKVSSNYRLVTRDDIDRIGDYALCADTGRMFADDPAEEFYVLRSDTSETTMKKIEGYFAEAGYTMADSEIDSEYYVDTMHGSQRDLYTLHVQNSFIYIDASVLNWIINDIVAVNDIYRNSSNASVLALTKMNLINFHMNSDEMLSLSYDIIRPLAAATDIETRYDELVEKAPFSSLFGN